VADRLSAEITEFIDAEVELISSSGGIFEVRQDGELVFSKQEAGRLPKRREVPACFSADPPGPDTSSWQPAAHFREEA